MLHIYVIHSKNNTIYLDKITEDETILAEHNAETNMIDLDVCIPYVGDKIMVHHTFMANHNDDYSVAAKLLGVETDANGIKSVRYKRY